jgi:hypothetical protein
MELDITAYRLPSGYWAFDHPHNDTVGELLLNGTELAIDEYYRRLNGREAQVRDEIGIHLTTSALEDADSVLDFMSTDDFGTVYFDSSTSRRVWLCPWLQGYFGEKPQRIYAKVSRAPMAAGR